MRVYQEFQSRITIRERAPLAKGFKRVFNKASSGSWDETGHHFHDQMRDDRFTPGHAKEAGYYQRKGEGSPVGSKAFKRSYFGKKYKSSTRGGGANQSNPLEDSGDTRRAVRSARFESTRKGVEVSYAGARVLNYRNPRSRIRMNEEFKFLTDKEINKLATIYDQTLDKKLKD